MSHNILITGVSGYLGGSLLSHLHLHPDTLPKNYSTIYALVRTSAQAEAVTQYGAKLLTIPNISDQAAVTEALITHKITIVLFLIDAVNHELQVRMIKALAEVKKQTGLEVHFMHTSGAKIFSEHAGHDFENEILDSEEGLFDMQKAARAPHAGMQKAVDTNNTVIETAQAHDVKSYIFIPCIVYGEGQGFGNKISIQTVAIVRAAKALRRVYDVNKGNATWPVCHIEDNTTLYVQLLRKILSGEELGHGKHGYYLAASGSIAWRDIYSAMAKGLAARGAIDDDVVKPADDAVLEEMAKALSAPKETVYFHVGGRCALRAVHAAEIGWKPSYPPEHILEDADAEVDLILRNI